MNPPTPRPWDREQSGSAAVELVLITPLLVLLLLFVVTCGRVTTAQLRVTTAAHAAAHAASITRTSGAAVRAAHTAARQASRGAGPTCVDLSAPVTTSGLQPGGTVRVQVTCTVALADLALLHLPGSRSITATATSPIDRYRTAPGTGGAP